MKTAFAVIVAVAWTIAVLVAIRVMVGSDDADCLPNDDSCTSASGFYWVAGVVAWLAGLALVVLASRSLARRRVAANKRS